MTDADHGSPLRARESEPTHSDPDTRLGAQITPHSTTSFCSRPPRCGSTHPTPEDAIAPTSCWPRLGALGLQRVRHSHDSNVLILCEPPCDATALKTSLNDAGDVENRITIIDPRHRTRIPLPESGGRWDSAIVDGSLLDWPALTASSAWLGSLRDRLAAETIIVLPSDDPGVTLPDPGRALIALLAHGFRRLTLDPSATARGRVTDAFADHTARASAPSVTLFRVALHDYKTVPDWLNARFWAHPERWGKAFW